MLRIPLAVLSSSRFICKKIWGRKTRCLGLISSLLYDCSVAVAALNAINRDSQLAWNSLISALKFFGDVFRCFDTQVLKYGEPRI